MVADPPPHHPKGLGEGEHVHHVFACHDFVLRAAVPAPRKVLVSVVHHEPKVELLGQGRELPQQGRRQRFPRRVARVHQSHHFDGSARTNRRTIYRRAGRFPCFPALRAAAVAAAAAAAAFLDSFCMHLPNTLATSLGNTAVVSRLTVSTALALVVLVAGTAPQLGLQPGHVWKQGRPGRLTGPKHEGVCSRGHRDGHCVVEVVRREEHCGV
mmetsp:Transcript_56549/g.111703  ORF Transcript_56549/g.111703 Transcript_56549/m.111703 type:complete len:212 (+) Transcript_56549:695-1330(+)